MTITTRILAIAALAVAALAVGAAPAGAERTSGQCTASINGVDVTNLSASDPDDAVEVDPDDDIQVEARSPARVDTHLVQLEYAGIRWTTSEGETNSNTWTREVNISDYATWGVGLYRVRASSTGPGACSGAALIKVGGGFITTIAGAASLVLFLLGVLGLVLSYWRGRRRRLPVGLTGLISGLLGGVGTVVLLQQASIAYPTRTLAIAVVAGFVVLTQLVRVVAWMGGTRGGPRVVEAEPVTVGGPAAAAAVASAPAPMDTPPAADPMPEPEPESAEEPDPPAPPWAPTHRVPPTGMHAWDAPDPARTPAANLAGGVELVILEHAGEWARVEGSNGWRGWVDSRLLQDL